MLIAVYAAVCTYHADNIKIVVLKMCCYMFGLNE